MSEIKFKNICVFYNDKEISKKKIITNNIIMYSGCILIIFLMFSTVFLIPENILSTIYGTALAIISSLSILIGGVGFLTLALKKTSPKHYEFVTWIKKFKYDDFEFGLFNGKYMVQAQFPKGHEMLSLEYFLNSEKPFQIIEEYEDKTKPLQLFIDCTKDGTTALVRNK